MRENVKNPSRNGFSEVERDIIDHITITLAVLFYSFIENHKDLRKMIEPVSKITLRNNDKDMARLGLTLDLKNMSRKEGMFPDQINKELARILLKGSKHVFLENQSTLSNVLKEFEDINILFRIKGKKNIKSQSSKSIKRKPKAGEAKRQGYPIVRKVTKTLKEYERILSNPNAVNLINTDLIKHGRLKKVYELLFSDVLNIFKKAGPEFYDFLPIFGEIFPEVKTDTTPNPQLFQDAIKSVGQDELEQMKKEFVNHLLENPLSGIFFIFSLAGLENNSY
jgi:hypothetical protein